jgi:hypothetical protein
MAIIVEGKKIPCHKAVLFGHSPYFRALFESGMKDSGSQEIRIDLHGISYASYLEFIRYVYCNRCSVTGDNFEELLELAYAEPFLTPTSPYATHAFLL